MIYYYIKIYIYILLLYKNDNYLLYSNSNNNNTKIQNCFPMLFYCLNKALFSDVMLYLLKYWGVCVSVCFLLRFGGRWPLTIIWSLGRSSAELRSIFYLGNECCVFLSPFYWFFHVQSPYVCVCVCVCVWERERERERERGVFSCGHHRENAACSTHSFIYACRHPLAQMPEKCTHRHISPIFRSHMYMSMGPNIWTHAF